MAIAKLLKDISEGDLQFLVTKPEPEGKTIEYKDTLPNEGIPSERVKFLSQVSSFANTIGGDLIYGIWAKDGVPQELRGLQISNMDATILSLRHIISNGLAPTLRGVDIEPIELPSKPGLWAIIIRIRKSWAAPHMVTFQDHGKFYVRDERGKRAIKIDELRAAFDLSGTTAESIRNFRANRLMQIISGDTPIPLEENTSKLVLHIISFGALGLTSEYDLRPLFDYNDHKTRRLTMMNTGTSTSSN
ncbi:MAG TPA: ATP-binding protein, partial [Ktedonobacterales bacterium]